MKSTHQLGYFVVVRKNPTPGPPLQENPIVQQYLGNGLNFDHTHIYSLGRKLNVWTSVQTRCQSLKSILERSPNYK